MEEAQKIFDYLPASYKNSTEKEYVEFLWDAFLSNYKAAKYPFAFISYHMLFMCFVYFEIWQIKENCPDDFQKAMVGFHKDREKELLASKTPFAFVVIDESPIFRFFKLIGLDNSDIGRFTKIVKDRNDAAHSNGNIFYKDQKSLEDKINEMLTCIETIQEKSAPIIMKAYRTFLIESSNPEEREFLDDESQIREIFVHGNYLSLEDVKIAKEWDISELSTISNFQNIQSLAQTLRNTFKEDE
ncbi:MAG: hypothetical protein MUF15_26845 [Acidobacteria bacterium]|jgi:hypothetical protein|nr:hypothetical protein [Acidobacteriota bacterium]